MQITEIRWATGLPGGDTQRYRMPLRRGVTFIRGRPTAKPDSFFARLQTDLIYPPDDSFSRDSGYSSHYWQFIFQEKDRFFSYSTDQATQERDQFFRQTIVGCEGGVLGGRIDFATLSGEEETLDAKKDQLEQLLSKMDESRRYLHDRSTGQGRILDLQSEIRQCGHEIEQLKVQAGTWPGFQQVIEKIEKRLAGLKAEDQRLAGEQRRIKQLLTRAEYEAMTKLQRELDETLEREGAFGSRITEKGHNITVHEMTRLTALQKEVADLEQEAGSVEQVLEATKEERIKAEQERVMTVRSLRDFGLEKDRLLELIGQEEAMGQKNTDQLENGSHVFPTRGQLRWLAALLVFAAGLLLTLFNRTAGAILAGLGALLLFGLGLRLIWHGPLVRIRSLATSRGQEQLSMLRSDVQRLSAQIAASAINLDRLENYIGELDGREEKLLAEAGAVGRKYRRLENELMRLIRQYAGPSESAEADDIITTLSRQRESSAHYNEMVADLQRRIAELKHGRSEKEMLREYQYACRELGDGDQTDETAGLQERALEISKERIDLAAAIDEAEGNLRGSVKDLSVSRESTVTLGGLERKYEALSESYHSAVHDYLCVNGAVAWLREILNQWKEIDISSWMALSASYLNRLTGRRPGGQPVSLPGVTPRGKLRVPKFSYGAPADSQTDFADLSAFSTAPQSTRYLAVRMGLVAAQQKGGLQGTPLLFLEPAIPSGYSQGENILSALEEWSMETGQQIVYLTNNQHLIAIARARAMNLYYPG